MGISTIASFYSVRHGNDGVFFNYFCGFCREPHNISVRNNSGQLIPKITEIFPNAKQDGRIHDILDGHTCACPKCERESIVYYDGGMFTKFSDSVFTHAQVEGDYKRIQLSIWGFSPTYFGRKMQLHHYMSRIVFNLRTGRLSVLRPLLKNNKPLPGTEGYAPIRNATFSFFSQKELDFINHDQAVEFIRPLLLAELKKRCPQFLPNYRENFFDDLESYTPNSHKSIVEFLNVLNLHIRFHDLPFHMAKEMSLNIGEGKNRQVYSGVSFRSKDQYRDLLKGMKLPFTKWVRKRARTIEDMLLLKKFLLFKQTANIDKIMTAYYEGRDPSHERIFEPIDDGNHRLRVRKPRRIFDIDEMENLYELYFDTMTKNQLKNNTRDGATAEAIEKAEAKAETLFVNKYLKERPQGYLIRDTIRTINRLAEEGHPYEIDSTWTFKRTHDDASSVLDKLDRPNVPLPQDEDVLGLQFYYGDFIFEFAEDTHHLIDIGKHMNICVGGYDHNAKNKKLHIMQVRTKEDPYVCCIELTGDHKTIRQTKTQWNHKPKDELREAILMWIKEKNLKIDTHDIKFDTEEEDKPYRAPDRYGRMLFDEQPARVNIIQRVEAQPVEEVIAQEEAVQAVL